MKLLFLALALIFSVFTIGYSAGHQGVFECLKTRIKESDEYADKYLQMKHSYDYILNTNKELFKSCSAICRGVK